MIRSSPAAWNTLPAWSGVFTTRMDPCTWPICRWARSRTAMPELSVKDSPLRSSVSCRGWAWSMRRSSYSMTSLAPWWSRSPATSAVRQRSFSLQVPGEHNVYNAMAAIALADLLAVNDAVIMEALRAYTGTDRRFEYKGSVGGVAVIDDYAHHPAEITATLKAAAHYPHRKLWCVFQPHTYSRTKAFLKEFALSLSLADHVVLAEIYPARETDDLGMSSALLQLELAALGKDCHYFPTFDEIENFLLENCINGDMLITMGAGDVVKIGETLLGN